MDNYSKPLTSLAFTDATLSSMKWLAVALMVIDHVGKYVFKDAYPWMYAAGRLSMPLFAFVVGYNLARPEMKARGALERMGTRLFFCALLATPAFIALNKLPAGWWPLNMLFTFGVAVATVWALRGRAWWNYAAVPLIFLCGGALVEFWWPAVALVLCVYWFQRSPNWFAASCIFLSLLSLWVINGNHWALMSIPLIVTLSIWRLALPRAKWFFYAFYPSHLYALWAIAALQLQG